MKLRIASDLHLEAFPGRDIETLFVDFLPHHEKDDGAVLILAGDISSQPDQLLAFVKVCEARFKHVLYVPGNHEYYRQHYQNLNAALRKEFSNNFTKTTAACGDVVQVVIDDVRFLLSTLWADGGNSMFERQVVQTCLNDFRLIRYDFRTMNVADMVREHERQAGKLKFALSARSSSRATVVVTHHMPSYTLCHPRFGGDANGGFASNMDDLMMTDTAPNIWIHGHTHDTGDRFIGNTRVICNPRGYRGEWSTEFNTYGPLFVDV